MKISVTVDSEEIQKSVIEELFKYMKEVSAMSNNSIASRVKALVLFRIQKCPEYSSLAYNGSLAGELGVVNASDKLDRITRVWLDNIRFTTYNKRVGKNFGFSFAVDLIRSDYSDVLASPDATYTTDKGEVIPWLEWLLLAGQSVLIRNYDVVYRPQFSRTGLDIMINKKGVHWSVPAEYSGTAGNNFVTKALEGVEDEILEIVNEEVQKLWG